MRLHLRSLHERTELIVASESGGDHAGIAISERSCDESDVSAQQHVCAIEHRRWEGVGIEAQLLAKVGENLPCRRELLWDRRLATAARTVQLLLQLADASVGALYACLHRLQALVCALAVAPSHVLGLLHRIPVSRRDPLQLLRERSLRLAKLLTRIRGCLLLESLEFERMRPLCVAAMLPGRL